jgi:alanyl-tRNA synthetase
MNVQREKARDSWKGSGEQTVSESYQKLSVQGISTAFAGYEGVTEATSHITAIMVKDEPVESVTEGRQAEIFVEQTPFYGEAGGQVGDTGTLEGDGFLFEVWDTRRPLENLITHIGKLKKGRMNTGDRVDLKVEVDRRRATEAHHSGTHILNAALRSVLGNHIKQSGSLVNPERLRFDFTHFSKIGEDELERIEILANDIIRENFPVVSRVLPREEAMKTGATADFDEKYGEEVRLVRMGDVTMELCGGTHVSRTGDVGFLKIIHESAIAAGVRRIEAVAGREAVKYVRRIEGELKHAAGLLKTNPSDLPERIEKQMKHQKDLEKEIEGLKGKLAAKDSSDLLNEIKEIKGIRVLATMVDAADVKTLRDLGDKVRDKIQSGIVLLGSKADDKAMLLCLVTKDLTDRYHAGNIIKEIAPIVGGSGGGRPDMAQAGGSKPENLKQAIERLKELV